MGGPSESGGHSLYGMYANSCLLLFRVDRTYYFIVCDGRSFFIEKDYRAKRLNRRKRVMSGIFIVEGLTE